jgi:hypothetical protein
MCLLYRCEIVGVGLWHCARLELLQFDSLESSEKNPLSASENVRSIE